jgi:hypothetical protein
MGDHFFGVGDELDWFFTVEWHWLVRLDYEGFFVYGHLGFLQRDNL